MKKYKTTFWAITYRSKLLIDTNNQTKEACTKTFLWVSEGRTWQELKKDSYGCVHVTALWEVKP